MKLYIQREWFYYSYSYERGDLLGVTHKFLSEHKDNYFTIISRKDIPMEQLIEQYCEHPFRKTPLWKLLS